MVVDSVWHVYSSKHTFFAHLQSDAENKWIFAKEVNNNEILHVRTNEKKKPGKMLSSCSEFVEMNR